MAEEQPNQLSNNQSHSDDEEIDPSRIDNSLENFVTEHYEKQEEERKMDDTSEIDEDRRNHFFTQALKESRRMSSEVAKSHQKIEKLHTELGAATFAQWRNEHASEVLLPHQMEAVELASHSAESS